MNNKLQISNMAAPNPTKKEGELYKIVTAHGKTFELRYGYYSDGDRRFEPDVIYPDFIKDPLYTESGEPFVTAIQDACEKYIGEHPRTSDSTCADCKRFQPSEEWIGICKSEKSKQ